jgi:glutamate-1-semialdehyde 2,1-aminomutase
VSSSGSELRGLNNISSSQLQRRAHDLIPGGCHTYAKGDEQFPESAPPFIARGSGCHVWDRDGNRFIEYGMGLRAVTLGHAFGPVIDAVKSQLEKGVNFSRPAPIEVQCAEELLALIPSAQMVKFCKDGSDAVDGAIRLARAFTGRDLIAICGDHPFFSTSDWFIGTTEMNAGIPEATRNLTLKFAYNDLASLEELFTRYPEQISCVVMEAARTEEPAGDYLHKLRALAHRNGALLILDEMITGFRWHLHGAQHVYGVEADLCTFGKALANGFSVSALAGRREIMQLGGGPHKSARVFLLSTTHGAETHQLAAALASMRFYRENPVVETLYARGARLRRGFNDAVADLGLESYVDLSSRDCNLLFTTRGADHKPSQVFRTLFMQEMIKRRIIAPSFVVSYAHSELDIDATIEAVRATLLVYRQALESGPDKLLEGRSVKPVFRRFE